MTNGHQPAQVAPSRPFVGKRSLFPGVFVVARKYLEEAVSAIAKRETFRVKLDDASSYTQAMERIVNRIDSLTVAIRSMPSVKDIPAQTIKVQSVSDEALATLASQLEALGGSLKRRELATPTVQEVKGTVEISNPVKFPSLQRINGDVTVKNPTVFPVSEILDGLKRLEETVRALKLEVPQAPEIRIPEFPRTVGLTESKMILKALEDLKVELEKLPKSFPAVDFPKALAVTNFPPQKYPLPVTNININPLRGFVNSRQVTLGTSTLPLPATVLANRRAMIVYNNSNNTLYLGGSDVTTLNGMIIPANSYSPVLDAGERMIVYGVASAGGTDVRVLELSNDKVGG